MSGMMKTFNDNTAEACREMGVKVGDTIIGREGGEDWWHEAALTLLWIGEDVAVFRYSSRTSDNPKWRLADRETASWDLTCRDWRFAEPGEVTA